MTPQCEYHSEVCTRHGPKGSFFLQDFRLISAPLEEITRQQDALQLSAADRLVLQASGAKTPGRLGEILMESFRDFIKGYQSDTEVNFVVEVNFVMYDPKNVLTLHRLCTVSGRTVH